MRRYLVKISGLSKAQITRLIARWRDCCTQTSGYPRMRPKTARQLTESAKRHIFECLGYALGGRDSERQGSGPHHPLLCRSTRSQSSGSRFAPHLLQVGAPRTSRTRADPALAGPRFLGDDRTLSRCEARSGGCPLRPSGAEAFSINRGTSSKIFHSARLARGAGPQSPSCSTVASAQGFGNSAHLVLRRTRSYLGTVQSVASPAQGGPEVCGTAWVCEYVCRLRSCGTARQLRPRYAFEFPAIPVETVVVQENSIHAGPEYPSQTAAKAFAYLSRRRTETSVGLICGLSRSTQ